MSRTLRIGKYKDGEVSNPQKDKNPKKHFVFHGDHWATKSNGGPGNKRGWKSYMPKWVYKKLKLKID